MRKSSRLILALDETDKSKALAIAGSVAGLVDAIKINWPLVLSAGPEIITELSKFSDVICDFKVADTVAVLTDEAVPLGDQLPPELSEDERTAILRDYYNTILDGVNKISKTIN